MKDDPENSPDGLIEALSDPHRYPHPVGAVEVRQTHLSWVLLAGGYAYKIKKPVKFAFVDLSTLELRRQDCIDEVRLNRRFAPHLYVDVIAITGTTLEPVIGGDSPAIEYAVRLHRFDEDDELSKLLARDAVSALDMQEFGGRLADIHERSPVCDPPGSGPRAFLIARDNINELRKFQGAADEGIRRFGEWLRNEWTRIAALAEARSGQGRVRECHGDLHVENIARVEGELTAYDCIAFNAALSCIDVVSDVAFLFMDLAVRRRRDFAYAFLNGWLEQSGDYEGIALLRFFSMHRCLVRAKVALIGQERERADNYLEFAHRLAEDARPALIITCGLSGSGKTWFSSHAMTQVPAVRVRSDVERKRLAGLRPLESSRERTESIYSLEFNERVYSHLERIASALLEARQNVIVDAAFLKIHEREQFRRLASRLSARFRIVHCRASHDELRERLRERARIGTDASEADEQVLHKQVDAWEEFGPDERDAVLTVVTTDELAFRQGMERLRQLTP